jgi:hypothetical protein
MAVNLRIGSFVMLNIILSLVSFLLAMKVKKYSMSWGVFSIILGVLQFSRSFILPESASGGTNRAAVILTIASSLFAMAGGIVTIIKTTVRRNYLANRKV